MGYEGEGRAAAWGWSVWQAKRFTTFGDLEIGMRGMCGKSFRAPQACGKKPEPNPEPEHHPEPEHEKEPEEEHHDGDDGEQSLCSITSSTMEEIEMMRAMGLPAALCTSKPG